MIQYTDVELTVSVEGARLLSAEQVHLTFRQGYTVIDVTPTVLSDEDMTVVLPQTKTSMLNGGSSVSVQLNFVVGGLRKASNIVDIPVDSNLLRRILGNE